MPSRLLSYIGPHNLYKINFFRFFENLATGVLDVFDANTEDRHNISLLLNQVFFFKTYVLKMAEIGHCKKFVAHIAVQNLLTSIWYGKNRFKRGFVQNLQV
jgi:hypothetical protein